MARLTRAERTAIWQQRLDRYLQSNATVADFCKTEGISAPSFYQWKRRLLSQRQGDDEAAGRKLAVTDTGSIRSDGRLTAHSRNLWSLIRRMWLARNYPTAFRSLWDVISQSRQRASTGNPVADGTESQSASHRSC